MSKLRRAQPHAQASSSERSGYSVAVAQLDGKMAVSAIRGRRNKARLGQIQRTDGDVIFVRVSERKLHSSPRLAMSIRACLVKLASAPPAPRRPHAGTSTPTIPTDIRRATPTATTTATATATPTGIPTTTTTATPTTPSTPSRGSHARTPASVADAR
jgi:hypothetical protein